MDVSHSWALGCVVDLSPKAFMDALSLCVSPVRQNTNKINPLMTVKSIKLSALSIKQSKIPINPMKLINVRILNQISIMKD